MRVAVAAALVCAALVAPALARAASGDLTFDDPGSGSCSGCQWDFVTTHAPTLRGDWDASFAATEYRGIDVKAFVCAVPEDGSISTCSPGTAGYSGTITGTPTPDAPCTNACAGWWTVSTSGLTEGQLYLVTVRAYSQTTTQGQGFLTDGPTFASASRRFAVDTTAPSVAVSAPAAGATVKALGGPVTVSATAADTTSTVRSVTFDASSNGGSTWTTIGSSSSPTGTLLNTYAIAWDASALSGAYLLRAVATDGAGNQSTSATSAVTIQPDAPPTAPGAPTLDPGSTSPNRTGAFTVDWTGSTDPDGDPFTYTLQERSGTSGDWTTVAAGLTGTSYAFTGETEGAWAFRVEAVDVHGVAGAYAADTAAIAVVDTTGPTIVATATTGGHAYEPNTWTNGSVTVSFACSDALTGVATTAPDVVVSGQGTHGPVTGTCVDGVGNSSTATFGAVLIDTTAPVPHVTLTSNGQPYSGGWSHADVAVTWTCTDSGGSNVDPHHGGGGLTVGEPGRPDGATVSCLDNAGNVGTATTAPILVETTPPTATLALSSNGAPYSANTWTDAPVTVHTVCSDTPSGVTATTPDQVVSRQGSSAATGSCTDAAGYTVSATANGILIDTTAPVPHVTLTSNGQPYTGGWSQHPVSVTWTCTDAGGSGLDVRSANGHGLQVVEPGDASGAIVTCGDNAGNVGTATTAPILVETTPPTATLALSSNGAPYSANTWTDAPVTVHTVCSDTPSGVTTTTPDQVLAAEGADQTATGSCTDAAGYTASASAAGIDVDLTPPTLVATSVTSGGQPYAGGWTNRPVLATFACTDALSGVRTFTDTAEADGTQGTGGSQSLHGSCEDAAGNVARLDVPVQIDLTPPLGHASLTTADGRPYAAGTWTDQPVTVQVVCSDPQSGIPDPPASQVVSVAGADQHLTATCTDAAGNTTAVDSGPIDLDLTAPTVTASTGAYAPGTWSRSAVTVTFSCTDAGGSGVATVTSPVVVGDGANDRTVTGTCTDAAGNTATATVPHVDVDETAPTATFVLTAGGRTVAAGAWADAPVTVHTVCSDAGSGIPVQPADQTLAAEGADQHATATCTDAAGNAAVVTSPAVSIDLTPPVVVVSGDAGTYAATDTVHLTCTAGDALSGLTTDPCGSFGVDVQAASFGPGVHTVTVPAAVDAAGNTTRATATFTVTATAADLTSLTEDDVHGSDRYQRLGPFQRRVVDILTTASTRLVAQLGERLPPSRKGGLITAYSAALQGLVRGGWLTQGQAETLVAFARAL